MRLSLVIPTYNEKDNIKILIDKLLCEFSDNSIKGEIIVVDDNSPDGTGEVVRKISSKLSNVKLVSRPGKLGLSSAVLDGWKIAKGNILGVMDADLSHPPERVKDLFFEIKSGKADFSIGSRYIPGGKIEGWNFKRKLMSKSATLLARFFTKVKDPMTGFFMIKRECVNFSKINSKGFKILLELLVKAKYNRVKEIPITFVNRVKGKSKASSKEIIYYLKNLAGYLPYTRNGIKEIFKFGIVGFLGTLVNILFLYLFTEIFGIYYLFSAIFSFFIAMSNNFIFNKVWTFGENLRNKVTKKYLQFGFVSIVALLFNLIFLYFFTEIVGIHYLVSQVLAILLSFGFNFIGNKFLTFKR